MVLNVSCLFSIQAGRNLSIRFDHLVSLLQMLHLRDNEASGGSVIYRRLRKDRSYVTVQATGRAVGTRYLAHTQALASLQTLKCPTLSEVHSNIFHFIS